MSNGATIMTLHRWGFLGTLIIAAVALWLLLAGPNHLLGIDTGNAGIFLLMIVAWSALYFLKTRPRNDADEAVSPGEWRAWIGLAFTLMTIAYTLAKADILATGPYFQNPDAGAVGRNVAMLIAAWIVLSSVL